MLRNKFPSNDNDNIELQTLIKYGSELSLKDKLLLCILKISSFKSEKSIWGRKEKKKKYELVVITGNFFLSVSQIPKEEKILVISSNDYSNQKVCSKLYYSCLFSYHFVESSRLLEIV